MEIDSSLLNTEDDTINANRVKDMILGRLVVDKIITEDQYNIYSEKWQVVVIKRSWFKKWFKKFISTGDGWSYKYVKFED